MTKTRERIKEIILRNHDKIKKFDKNEANRITIKWLSALERLEEESDVW